MIHQRIRGAVYAMQLRVICGNVAAAVIAPVRLQTKVFFNESV
jgi:hypothetical protein